MPNRILKESICTSDTIDELTPEQEVFFYRLLTACDDYGRMDARPKILRAKLFPLRVDKITELHIEGWLKALTRAGLIFTYYVNDHRYLQVVTWETHQQVRAKRSKFPAPDSANVTSASTCNQMQSDDGICPRNPIQSESESNPIQSSAAEPPIQQEESKEFVVFPKESEPYRLTALLRSRILANNPKAKAARMTNREAQNWCADFDKMIRLDGREPPEIEDVIIWCQADTFWKTNILSAGKLREKFDALWLKMQQQPKENKRNGTANRRRNGGDDDSDTEPLSIEEFNRRHHDEHS
jgi:hypothetical protein